MKLAFLIDPIDRLDPTHDTSVAMMEAAQKAGHEVWISQASQLSLQGGQVIAPLSPLNLTPVTLAGQRWQAVPDWFRVGAPEILPLTTMDAVLMRTDPPVDTAYLYATYLLDFVEASGTRVMNSPRGLRAANEKLYAMQFSDLMARTIVSADRATIRAFVEAEQMAVLKPLGGKAGEGIVILTAGDRNFNSLVEISTHQGRLPVMVQQFLPAAQDGDKRVILLNGEPIGAVNRVPKGEEFRGNMAVGGQAVQADVTDRDREIAQRLAPSLARDGLYFVGIDVIGGYLTEVNVTSPTGVREIDRLDGVCVSDRLLDWLATGDR